MLAAVGVTISSSPLNLSFIIALVACVAFWLFVWKTKWGYSLRVVGANESAAVYGGISPAKQIMIAMTISGALAAGSQNVTASLSSAQADANPSNDSATAAVNVVTPNDGNDDDSGGGTTNPLFLLVMLCAGWLRWRYSRSFIR